MEKNLEKLGPLLLAIALFALVYEVFQMPYDPNSLSDFLTQLSMIIPCCLAFFVAGVGIREGNAHDYLGTFMMKAITVFALVAGITGNILIIFPSLWNT